MAFSPRESFWLVGMERVVGTHPEYETGKSMIQGARGKGNLAFVTIDKVLSLRFDVEAICGNR